LFPTRRGEHLSRDAVGHLVEKHSIAARSSCPSLCAKHPTPHTLRHTCAMELLVSGVDRTVIALWLGHERVETTAIYTHADMSIKERALARTRPLHTRPGRYRPPDPLLTFLEGLLLCSPRRIKTGPDDRPISNVPHNSRCRIGPQGEPGVWGAGRPLWLPGRPREGPETKRQAPG
jgi:hypothetical protein